MQAAFFSSLSLCHRLSAFLPPLSLSFVCLSICSREEAISAALAAAGAGAGADTGAAAVDTRAHVAALESKVGARAAFAHLLGPAHPAVAALDGALAAAAAEEAAAAKAAAAAAAHAASAASAAAQPAAAQPLQGGAAYTAALREEVRENACTWALTWPGLALSLRCSFQCESHAVHSHHLSLSRLAPLPRPCPLPSSPDACRRTVMRCWTRWTASCRCLGWGQVRGCPPPRPLPPWTPRTPPTPMHRR